MTPAAEPSPPEALIALAHQYARLMLSGEVKPYEGAERIWLECHLRLPAGDHRLDPFVYWTSEREDSADSERLALCDHALRTAAATLLEKGTAV